MGETTEAIYYDGQSSLAQKAIIAYNESMLEFSWKHSNGTTTIWYFNDLQFERHKDFLELRNKYYSGALLKIEDNFFSEKFYEAMKLHRRIDIHTSLLSLGYLKIGAIAMGLLGLIVYAYFYILPTVAEKAIVLLPDNFDSKIGDVFMETFLKENKIDSTKTKYLTEFAAELNLKNKKPLQFVVINSKEVNAFALPNGQIVIFSEILKNIKQPDELVALLGHEATHVNNRHSMKMLCRNLAGYMLVSLIFSDVNGIMAVLADNAQQLHSLSFSRAFEQEADEQGMQILKDNNVNPSGMVKLFEQLEKDSKISIPQIISSHPLTKERKKHMQKIISETKFNIMPNPKLNAIFALIKK